MDLGLKGRSVLVLGASAGIGKSVAFEFIKEGARVAICSRDHLRLQKTAEDIGAELAISCDLNHRGGCTDLVKKVSEHFNGLDILVTNTGGPPKGLFSQLDLKSWEEGFNGLWMSAIESIKAALPGMCRRKFGRILLITSVAAREPIDQLTVSSSLRSGLLGLVRVISREVASSGVTVNAILPGYTDTDRLRQLGVVDSILKVIPAQRLGKPEEIGYLATFLASNKAEYINGQSIAVDGAYLRGI